MRYGLQKERVAGGPAPRHLRQPVPRVLLDPLWQTPIALALAQHTHGSGDFSVLPILADGLEDAGRPNADTLGHCRADGDHVRGCWALDLIRSL
jgi:hypothetical protein